MTQESKIKIIRINENDKINSSFFRLNNITNDEIAFVYLDIFAKRIILKSLSPLIILPSKGIKINIVGKIEQRSIIESIDKIYFNLFGYFKLDE